MLLLSLMWKQNRKLRLKNKLKSRRKELLNHLCKVKQFSRKLSRLKQARK